MRKCVKNICMLPEDCPGFAHLAVVDEVSLYVLVGLHQPPGQSHARASLRVERHHLRRIAASKIYSENSKKYLLTSTVFSMSATLASAVSVSAGTW